MFKMMKNNMTIDLNVPSSFMKNQVVSNLNRILVVTIHKSEMRKKTLIFVSNQHNQKISLVVDVIARYFNSIED
jgi:hypothetical protein